jgi:hypothetical protein
MIIIKTTDSDIIVNEVEIYSLIYKREENVVSVDFKDGSRSTKKDIINVKTYPGTPDMTFVNNIEPEPEPEPEKIPISQVTVVEIGKLMDEMEEEDVLNRGKYQKGGLYIRFLNACRAYNVNIQTLEDLLKMGKADFRRLRNIGPQVIKLLDKVIETKYGITKW